MTIVQPKHASSQGATRMLSALLEARTGQILSEGRVWRIETALRPVLKAHGLRDMDELGAQLQAKAGSQMEADVINALLNNESSFFRDPQIFDMIDRQILTQMQEEMPKRCLRIWSAGCSTGQEAYSLAIRLRNNATRWRGWQFEILATDISSAAIEQAQAGLFSQMDVQRGLAVGDLLKWFEPSGDNWRVNAELRRMVQFRQDNLFDARAPSGAYDLLLCRNVLLYFTPARRQAVLRLLAAHSHADSVLVLGAGETVIGHGDDFCAHPDFRGVYSRKFCVPPDVASQTRRVG